MNNTRRSNEYRCFQSKPQRDETIKKRRLRWIFVSIAFSLLFSSLFQANAIHSRSANIMANMQLSTSPIDYSFWKWLAHRHADL